MLRDPKYEVSFSEYSSVSKVGPFSHCCCGSVTSLEIQYMCVVLYMYISFSLMQHQNKLLCMMYGKYFPLSYCQIYIQSILSTMYNTLTCS